MRLYIVRHAWAGDRDPAQWRDDGQRPLTEKGAKRFRRVAKRLVKRGVKPAQIATSPLVRCLQTAQILCDRIGIEAPIHVDALAPGATLEGVLAATAELEGEEVAWCGHAPEVGELVARLIDSSATIDMEKGAVAAIDFDGVPQPGAGRLVWLVTAKVLGA
jgi:phosphohistidine phosphatase